MRTGRRRHRLPPALATLGPLPSPLQLTHRAASDVGAGPQAAAGAGAGRAPALPPAALRRNRARRSIMTASYAAQECSECTGGTDLQCMRWPAAEEMLIEPRPFGTPAIHAC